MRERSGRTTMFEDDVTFKLYAAAEEDDERDLDAEDAEYTEDEEEEESYSGGDLDDGDYEPTTTHVEQIEVFAMPATAAAPYEPPTRMAVDAVAAAAKRAAVRKAVKRAIVKKAIKKALAKKAVRKAVAKKAIKRAAVKKAVKKAAKKRRR